MDEKNYIYSGALQEGWNTNGSYNRFQFLSNNIINGEDFCEIVNCGLSKISETSNTRLDIRCFISDDFDISYILNEYKYSDIAIKNIDGKRFIIFGINIGERKLAEEKINYVKDFINNKVNGILEEIDRFGGFESYALSQLNTLLDRGFIFERENFGVDEVFELWGYSFGWAKDDISNFIKLNIGNDKMFGLRDMNGLLIALVMIGDDYETTEWSVLKEYQGTGTIEPLLILTNGILINNGCANNVYAHMRWNRSIGPGFKSGLRINQDNGVDNILTNLVEVEGNMEHFVEGTLDTSLFTEELLEYIRNFTN